MGNQLIVGEIKKEFSVKNNFTELRFKKNRIVELICFLLIFLFIYAALSKIIDFPKFKIQLGQSPLLTAYVDLVAWAIPLLEFFISFMLAVKKFRLIGLYCSFSLMAMFSSYIVAITNFTDYIPCSCGGVLENMSWNQHLIFNISFTLLAAIGSLLELQSKNT